VCLVVAACGPSDRAQPEAPAAAPPAQQDDLYPAEIEPGIALAVRRTGSRQYSLYGATGLTDTIRLSVEDGHNMLFGPAAVPVQDGRFRIDLIADPTDRDHIFFYVTDAAGARLAVIPVDTARESTTAGPSAMLPAPPDLSVGAVGDRRTRVTADGLESPHFRVRWPRVREGDDAVRLQGETDLSLFRAEVRRHDRVLAAQQPRVAGSPATWNTFATELRVPGGIREGDAVVVATEAGDIELVFQPIRN